MTADAWLLFAWTVVGAAGLLVHGWVMRAGWRSRLRFRWLVILPPAAPLLAWKAGSRIAPVGWLILWLVYLGLRLLEP